MDDKKIYTQLLHWFPELELRKIPKKKYRRNFQNFLEWIAAEKSGNSYRSYLMKIDRNVYSENGLEYSAILHDHHVDIQAVQTIIRKRAKPLFEHFEKHKEVIGRYYNVHDQVYDIIFEEILNAAKTRKFEMLLIYAEHFYWLVVPNEDSKIEKFCKLFEKQFKGEEVLIEHYAIFDCSRST